MYGCECWTIKKAVCQRIDAFKLRCWRRLSRVPWTAKTSNQSILKETNPEYSLEGLMLKLKLQYFGHLIYTGDSLEKTLMLGEIEGKRRREWQGMRWLGGTTNLIDLKRNFPIALYSNLIHPSTCLFFIEPSFIFSCSPDGPAFSKITLYFVPTPFRYLLYSTWYLLLNLCQIFPFKLWVFETGMKSLLICAGHSLMPDSEGVLNK